MLRNILAETLDRVSRNLALRPNYTMEEYQRWFDQNPEYMHNGAMQHIQLTEPLTLEGTNNLYRANYWLEHLNDPAHYAEQEIVVKICKFWASPGKNRLHRLNMLLSAFQDEIRINNLIRATNIEGVVQSMGGGIAGRHPYLKMEFIKGCSLDLLFKKDLNDDEVLHRDKFSFADERIQAVLDLVKSGLHLSPTESDETFPDPDDLVFYEVALSKDGSYVVTGNQRHFPKTPIVVSPAEMLTIMGEMAQ